ncbi:ABC transporter ATP-binding protein [Limnohabitans sp. TS-CS-82]|uniref:ABC transporter ATP-binding protein/permease n=1 Tax=Limnohabitans sp. TS-CS-82 TaxID=2094193 RepID=UPI000CF247AD|nr:ABC transporter ATP-binding protein/permease [Limnohabitans sp. TS-CS-82]PQA84768.1 ABC transporter ATP-binding protein [Limnohabitans sp. TS-CS-82]
MNAFKTVANNVATNWQKSRLQLSRVWALSLPYFKSEEKWRARLLLAACVGLNLGMVYMMVLFNDWNRVFYDALQNRDAAVFWHQLGVFAMLATCFIIVAVYRFYLTQLLQVRWRAWMTRDYLQRWLKGHVFYQLELQSKNGTDNPDQRIQEDVQQFTADTVSLSLGLLDASVTLLSFVGILWGLSGGFSFDVLGETYNIPGFMVWMALTYALAGSLIGHFIGRSMASLNFTQQRLEADFRHHLMRVREYSEAIALDRGGRVERLSLQERFALVLDNFMRLLRVQKRYTWFNSGYGQAAVVFPMLVASPRYFSGAIQLGELMQISSAFGQVQESLSWFISNYSRLASWQATTLRLTSFQDQMLAIKVNEVAEPAVAPLSFTGAAPVTHTGINALHTTPLTISLPNGEVLLADTSLNAAAGDTVLIRGPSGCGKSTLLRVLAGIWPHVTSPTHDRRGEPITYGPVVLPERSVFMPQRPYFPEGTLRQALAYPDSAEHYTDEALKNALYDALLPHLVNDLDVAGQWTQQLSGGEQQRLALARVLLKRPRWVFADEATSALDEAAEKTLYEKLLTMVREEGGGLVSIAHRASVASYHDTVWQFVPAPEGSAAKFILNT